MGLTLVKDLPDEQMLTIKEAAAQLGISQTTLRRIIDDGEIGVVDHARPGAVQRALRIPGSQVKKYSASRYIEPRVAS